MRVILSSESKGIITSALKNSNSMETGGILVGRIINSETLEIIDSSKQRKGSSSFFFRNWRWKEKRELTAMLKQHEFKYEIVNYCGEWHSHPSFPLYPSQKDLDSMWDLCLDNDVGAHFLVLIIAKLDKLRNIQCACYYFNEDNYPIFKQVIIEY